MSYLDIPRIHFGGTFFTDPSTVNNDPTHYLAETTNPSPWQNPNGEHKFQFVNCKITSGVGPNGPVNDDSIIGLDLITTDNPSPAKIVDLDVYQQGVPTIFGLQLQLIVGTTTIVGTIDPITLNLIWFNAVLPTRSWQDGDYVQDSFGGDMNACGNFQSIIRFKESDFPETSSVLLNTLRASTLFINGEYLVAVKFVLDGYKNVPQDVNYQTGRIVGTFGPLFTNEPMYNPGQRWLMPRAFSKDDPWYSPSFNNCPFKVDLTRKKLVFDLANSICRETAGGAPVDLGQLYVDVSTDQPVTTRIGAIDYSEFAYNNNAHITEIDLNDGQISMIQKGTLNLVSSRQDIGNATVLTEPMTATQFAVEMRPFRLEGNPGTTASTRVYVSQKGKPYANKQLGLFIESVHGNTPGATVPPTNPGNTPQADGALTATITPSDADGYATVTMTVTKDPGQRTEELDGQLYFIVVYDPNYPHIDWSNPKSPAPPQDQMISVLVFSQYPVNENPSWEIVQNMLAPYMKLYPGMKSKIDLTVEETFTLFSFNPPWIAYNEKNAGPLGITRGAIPYYFSRDFTSPMYMPVTRDLSPSKILTIMHYIKNLQSQ